MSTRSSKLIFSQVSYPRMLHIHWLINKCKSITKSPHIPLSPLMFPHFVILISIFNRQYPDQDIHPEFYLLDQSVFQEESMEMQLLQQDGRQHFLQLRGRFTPQIPPDLSQLTVGLHLLMVLEMEHFHVSVSFLCKWISYTFINLTVNVKYGAVLIITGHKSIHLCKSFVTFSLCMAKSVSILLEYSLFSALKYIQRCSL